MPIIDNFKWWPHGGELAMKIFFSWRCSL